MHCHSSYARPLFLRLATSSSHDYPASLAVQWLTVCSNLRCDHIYPCLGIPVNHTPGFRRSGRCHIAAPIVVEQGCPYLDTYCSKFISRYKKLVRASGEGMLLNQLGRTLRLSKTSHFDRRRPSGYRTHGHGSRREGRQYWQ